MMGRPPRDRDGENALAREVYEAERAARPLRVLRPPEKPKSRAEEEAEWAARSGPVRVRRLEVN